MWFPLFCSLLPIAPLRDRNALGSMPIRGGTPLTREANDYTFGHHSSYRANLRCAVYARRADTEPFHPNSAAGGGVASVYDFTALDQIMPHPVYGKMFWVCVLNPSAATFQSLHP